MDSSFLYLVRHGEAQGPREAEDSERALTPRGRNLIKDSLAGLKKLVPKLDCIYTSPFQRTRETAEIIHSLFCQAVLEEKQELSLQGAAGKFVLDLSKGIQTSGQRKSIMLVSHQPQLFLMAQVLLKELPEYLIFGRGSVCCIELGDFKSNPEKLIPDELTHFGQAVKQPSSATKGEPQAKFLWCKQNFDLCS